MCSELSTSLLLTALIAGYSLIRINFQRIKD